MSSGGGENRDRKKFYVFLFAVAFGVNLIWEISQMSAFDEKPGETMSEKLFFCSLASVIDALTTVGIFGCWQDFCKKLIGNSILSPLLRRAF